MLEGACSILLNDGQFSNVFGCKQGNYANAVRNIGQQSRPCRIIKEKAPRP